MRVLLPVQNGREEDRSREAQTTHAGADRQEAQGGTTGCWPRARETPEVCKALEVSEATYHRWRAQYGGMKADDVKRLKELERENSQLKRLVADKELENEATSVTEAPRSWRGRHRDTQVHEDRVLSSRLALKPAK